MNMAYLELLGLVLERYKPTSPVLDLGCAGTEYQRRQGYDLRKIVTDAGLEYVGLDREALAGVDIVADVLTWTPEPDKYGLVICTEMLEHCENPMAVPGIAKAAMKPGGLFLCTAPWLYPKHNNTDFFRFTDTGLKLVCRCFEMLEFGAVGTGRGGECMEHYFLGKKGDV